MANPTIRRSFPAMLLRRLAVLLALVSIVLAPATAGHAQDTVEDVEAKIDAQWRKLEPLIEEYNKVRSELKENEQASDDLAEKIAPLEASVGTAQDELAEIAVEQYKAGPMPAVGALLTSGSPTTFVDQLASLDRLARQQQTRIDEASETLAEYEAQKAEIDALIEEQERQKEDLAERKEKIEADLEELEELLEEAGAAEQQQAEEQDQGSTGNEQAASGSCPEVSSSGPGATAANFACAQIGKPYEFGANGPGSYDCSGLTQQAWAAAGVSLTHHTGAQWNQGAAVSRSEAAPGDLVFFYDDLSHVGVYIGNGMMAHAPRPGLTVQTQSIDVMPIAGFRRP